MHELAITQSVIDTITERLPDARITAVRLRIGKLSGVLPEAVQFCFGLVSAGTRVEGARLDITEPAGRVACRRCGGTFETSDPLAVCRCGSADVVITGGRDLTISAVEVAGHV